MEASAPYFVVFVVVGLFALILTATGVFHLARWITVRRLVQCADIGVGQPLGLTVSILIARHFGIEANLILSGALFVVLFNIVVASAFLSQERST